MQLESMPVSLLAVVGTARSSDLPDAQNYIRKKFWTAKIDEHAILWPKQLSHSHRRLVTFHKTQLDFKKFKSENCYVKK